MKQHWCKTLLALWLVFWLQPGYGTELPQLQKVGSGRFSYWVWHLYDAELYSSNGRFTDYQQSTPLQLTLTYARNISKTEFIEATLDQWKILQPKESAAQRRWAAELELLWRDVKKGDQLTALLQPDGIIRFYFNNELLGSTTDAAMGPAFFDIWLSESTTAPELRQQLLAGA